MKIDWTSPSCSPSPRVTHWAGDTPTILVLCRAGVDSVKVVKEVKEIQEVKIPIRLPSTFMLPFIQQ